MPERFLKLFAAAERELRAPMRGITTPGRTFRGLFPIAPTGVSAAPIRERAIDYLETLSGELRSRSEFPVTSDQWRRWNNTHPNFMRHGLCLEDMSAAQLERALALVASAMSADGYATARNVMRLNETLREITGSDDEYGEWLYWLSIFGEPSAVEPWGFQLDGHHVIINCFVLGDQVVMTPMFLGSEPTLAESGKFAGTRVFAREESLAIEFAQSLTPPQFEDALLEMETPAEVFAGCYRDNLDLSFEGIAVARLDESQRGRLLDLVAVHVERIRGAHARLKLLEIQEHLDETYFAWMGSRGDDGVFYYRVHSPVLLIEFDHEAGIALDNDYPSRNHIHSVVRTPNGNDYGLDLLRQHYQSAHAPLDADAARA